MHLEKAGYFPVSIPGFILECIYTLIVILSVIIISIMKRTRPILWIQEDSDEEPEINITSSPSNNTIITSDNNNNNNNNNYVYNNNSNNNNNNNNNNNHNNNNNNNNSESAIIIISSDSDSELDITSDYTFDIPQYIQLQQQHLNTLHVNHTLNNNNNNTLYTEGNASISIFCFEKCSKQCGIKICKELVTHLRSVWTAMKYPAQQAFISSLVIPRLDSLIEEKSIVGYALPVGLGNSEHVCTRFLCKLFSISSKRLVRITKHQRLNWKQLPTDARGSHSNSHKEKYDKDEIRRHILSFPRYYTTVIAIAKYLIIIGVCHIIL
jgi:hypothetical protein